jgi:hypothetical protein
MEEMGSNPAAQQSANYADNDVTNAPVTAPFYDHPGQPAGDQTNDNPGKYSHSELLFFLYYFLQPPLLIEGRLCFD